MAQLHRDVSWRTSATSKEDEELLKKEEARLSKAFASLASTNSSEKISTKPAETDPSTAPSETEATSSSADSNNSTEPKKKSLGRRPAWSTVTVRKLPIQTITKESGEGSSSAPTETASSAANETAKQTVNRPPSSDNVVTSPGKTGLVSAGRSQSSLVRQHEERRLVSFIMLGEPNGADSFDLVVKEEKDAVLIQAQPTVRQETVTVFITGAFLRFEALHTLTKKEGGATIKETKTLSQEVELPFTPTLEDLLFRPDPKGVYLEVRRRYD
eukprot:TRINITY_DN3001_c0_g1_i1.p1 TRINITY_DN3001_c0_g1~~TRINITY_DN3001_c0_g1_i1.p1  ORF type:complete len:271 (-),score=111.63 TRINITY_DN3001_c0_g1_i1:195-1007(-)